MSNAHGGTNRRTFLALGLGGVALAGMRGTAQAPAPGALEQANLQVVKAFCDAWPGHDLERILSFFADNGAYRMTETMEPAKGRDALAARIGTIIKSVERFEILDTFARGPMVVNERMDHFSNFPLQRWHGVGVFFLKDGKIVEWYDYTIASERA